MTPPEAPVEIVPYDPSWPVRFEEEAAILRRGLAAWLVGPIEHIGSTAVPGLAAKPVMQPEVAAEYETLKRKLAGQYRLDRGGDSFALVMHFDYCCGFISNVQSPRFATPTGRRHEEADK